MDPSKLKVVELRAELSKRGLDQKGNKPVLISRLLEAMEADQEDDDEEVEAAEEEAEPDDDDDNVVDEGGEPAQVDPLGPDETSVQSGQSSDEAEVRQPEEDSAQFSNYQDESESMMESEVKERLESDEASPQESDEESRQETDEESRQETDEVSRQETDEESRQETDEESRQETDEESRQETDEESRQETDEASRQETDEKSRQETDEASRQETDEASRQETDEVSRQEGAVADDSLEAVIAEVEDSSNPSVTKQEEDTRDENVSEEQESTASTATGLGAEQESSIRKIPSSINLDDSNAQDAMEAKVPAVTDEIKPDVSSLKMEVDGDGECKDVDLKKEYEDADVKTEVKTQDEESTTVDSDGGKTEPVVKRERREGERKRKNRWDDNSDVAKVTEAKKRPRSKSPEKKRWSPPRKVDDEPDFDENAVLLSWYDSDLHLVINKENFFAATPMNEHGFGFVWAGARASHGYQSGKVYYEVRITEEVNVSYLEDEPNPNVLRTGWSVKGNSLQLGEEPLSYGYGGTGKTSTNCKFTNYGKPFTKDDVIGCYMNATGSSVELSFTLNGEYHGVAYSIPEEELKGEALFPHILTKNCSFEVNFGGHEPWAEPQPDYINVGMVLLEDRVAGPRRPVRKEDCEVIMMCGLPGCGKTTWAKKYAEEHKDKAFNILGTNSLIDKMKVMGMPRRRNYHGRWDVLIAKCTKCLNSLLEICSGRRRNYIIDQTNVYPSAQRRKLRPYEGFVRRAVVIVPTDEELKVRTSKREDEEGKEVPDSAILEMKANFGLPEKGDLFNEVTYTELDETEARTLVQQYNKEGNDAGYSSKFQQPAKRFRPDDNRERSDWGNRGGDGGGYTGNRGGYDNRNSGGYDNRSSGYDNRDRGGWRDGGGGGGYSDFRRRPDNRGQNWRENRGGGGGSGGGGGGWRGGSQSGGRFNDRGSRDIRGDSRGGRDFWGGDRRDGGDRRTGNDRDDKNRQQKPMGQGQQQGWGQQGYNQAWGQGNWGWGNQGYGQQWKGYSGQQQQQQQQTQQQSWGQQGWGGQWANTGWGQQYYNAYQQGWSQQAQQGQQGQLATTAATGQTATTADATSMAAAYAGYNQQTQIRN